MDLIAKLKEKGWYLTDAGLNKILATTNCDGKLERVIEVALDWDLREIAGSALPHKREEKPNDIVLQIQKVRNISAAKFDLDSKGAPRMLLLELTDGQTMVQALEMESIPALSINLPPGTKVLLKGNTISHLGGYFQLRNDQVQVLGGSVQELKEKWEIARSMNRVERTGTHTGSDTGPPAWVAFGKKVQPTELHMEKDFKSLQTSNIQKKGDNESFNTFRSEAIAEATKQGSKKVFSGSGQPIVDHNMKKIMDKGYTEEVAKRALAQTKNNLERAFGILKRAKGGVSLTAVPAYFSSNRQHRQNANGGNITNNDKLGSSKPTGNVALSEFLADKLPTRKSEALEKVDIQFKEVTSVVNEKLTVTSNTVCNNNQTPQKEHMNTQRINKTSGKSHNAVARPSTKFENNMSSSFAAANQRNASVGGGSNSTINSNYNRSHENKDKNEHIIKQNNRIDNNPSRGGGYENVNARGNYRGRGRSNHNMENMTESKTYNEDNEELPNFRQNERNNRQNIRMQKAFGVGKNNNSRNNGISSSNNNRAERHKNDNCKPLENGVKSNARINYSSIAFTSKCSFGSGAQRWTDTQKTQKNSTIDSKQVNLKKKPVDDIALDQYDSSKIIGFQSKETNELAMSLLKSQGVNIKTLTTTNSTSAPTATPTVTIPQSTAASQQRLKQNSIEPLTQPEHSQQQKGNKQQNENQELKKVQTETLVPQNTNDYGMVPNETWTWNLGDICLAKYWDDGCYYEAAITAISDKTFVVYFMGYGNHEEVLKTDCLPITDVNHMAINKFSHKTYTSQHNNAENPQQRQRYERQVYVPPPKRSET